MGRLSDLWSRFASNQSQPTDERSWDIGRQLGSVVPTSASSAIRLVKFALVGAAGAVVDMSTLATLVELWNVAPVVATIVGKELSITLMFAINQSWTFADAPDVGIWGLLRRFLTSNAVRWVGGGVGVAVLAVLYHVFDVWYLLANFIGICAGFVVNYLFESLVTFRIE